MDSDAESNVSLLSMTDDNSSVFSRCHSPLSRVDLPLVHPTVTELRGPNFSRRLRPRSDGDVWAACLNSVDLSVYRSITDQSCLKVYHKDPAQAFSHAARPNNGDARMHRELMYASRDAPPLMRQPSQGPPAPPTPHSMPSSPSRIPFGPRSSGSGATIPRERPGHPLATPTRSASPCPSAILERRDVKPDEDVAAKGLVRGGEGLYGDPFILHHHAPPPETLDLAYHRASIRTYGVPGMPMEPMDHHSLFRQKSWKTPPSSPHRMGDMRMMEIHASQTQGTLGLERSSPIRQSFRKDGPVAVDKGRSAMGSPVTPDLQAHGNLVTPADPQTRERMRAMEEQIASLTGLVQHALLKGPSNSRGDRENASDISVKSGSPVHSTSSTGGSPVLGPKIGTVVPDSGPAQTPPIHSTPLQVNLHQFRKNVSELRFQLQKMRQLQLQNQEFVHAQIKQAAQEINLRLVEALKRQEDPSHRQRVLVEEERHKYLNMEEKVLEQLGDLERYVESLKKDSTPRVVTLKEVEEGAVGLRKVGESLAGLKGEFPGLQTRMRAVLRVEVEAVKFLKEEPHKLDSMLKRVKTLTDALSTLRKCATEGLPKPSDPVSNTTADEVRPVAPAEFHDPVTFLEPQNSSVRSEAASSSPGLIHRTQSSSVPSRQSQQTPRPSPTPETATKPSANTEKSISAQPEHGTAPSSSSNGVSLNKACRNGAYSGGGHDGVTSPSLFIEEIMSHSKKKNRATSIEAAEREWEDRRQNLGHYDSQEFERMLQEAEANMLRGIPSLEVPDKSASLSVPTTMPPVAREELVEKPKYSAPAIQDDKQPAVPSSDKSTKTEKASKSHHPTEKPAKSAMLDRHLKPNLTNKTSLDRGPKAQDKAAKLNQGSEKANKSPPPPPPRKNYTTPTGMTTTRSGDVVYTSRRESGSAQEGEADAAASAPQPKPNSSPEVKPKPCTPPATTSAMVEEDDEGDKIMAELQHNTEIQENKDLVTDETGNSMVRKTPGVIYYVTAQISKEPPEDSTDHRATSHSSASQVSHVNASDKSQNQPQVSTDGPSDIPDKGNISSDLPYKPFTRSSSLKSKTESPTEGPGSPTQGKVQVFKVPQVQVSIEERVESPTAICSPVSLGGPDLNYSQATVNSSEQSSTNQKPVVSSPKIRERQYKEVEDNNGTFLSPDLPGEEPPPPPPDNIAFMITNTKVQALSTGEYQELVNAKKGNVQTVTVGSRPQTSRGSDSNSGNVGNSNGLVDAEASGYSKKPVIIIFDEPMDIRSAYKRLSTIFECEEELERMLAEERIEEESEENEEDEIRNAKQEGDKRDSRKPESASRSILSSSLASEGGILTEDARHDVKKKSKFKFPTKQLAALTQAIRNGTKTGKKTLQVVVYEDEEESDGSIKQHKETKRFEIASKQEPVKPEPVAQETHGRTEEIRKSTYKTLDSLEQTIRQLESTINEMGPRPSEDLQAPEQTKTQDIQGAEDKANPPKTLVQKPSSSSKRPGLRKKPKPQLLPRPAVIPTKGVSVTSAAPQQVSF